jgi:dephospho-CoA kinase
VVEVPLLFEGSMAEMFDATIAISAGDAERERRANARGTGALEARSGRQLTQAEKAELATFAITNDGTVDDLRDALEELYPELRAAGR